MVQKNSRKRGGEVVYRQFSRQTRGYLVFVLVGLVVLVVTASVMDRRGDGALSDRVVELIGERYPFDTIAKGQREFAVREYQVLSIDLNRADVGTLKRVYGVGEVLSRRIVEYREALGGFVGVEQLKEVSGIDNHVYKKISGNFFVGNGEGCRRINLNTASVEEMVRHPYISRSMAERIVAARERSFGSVGELVSGDVLLPSEGERIEDYVGF